MPKPLLFLLAAVFVGTFSQPKAVANQVPPFVPNVVDESGTLTVEEREQVNAALADVRKKADIWGAVLLVDRLEGDSLESLAERTFKEWKLGRAKEDNGLLLLLAMKDRKSRFEVGYGLEGDIPDAMARRALDDVLRPAMREGRVKDAIIQAFFFLAAVKSKDPAYQGVVDEANRQTEASSMNDLNVRHGLIGLGIFYFCLWFWPSLAKARARSLARRLESSVPDFRVADDKGLSGGSGKGGLFLRLFFTLNPGVFIFLGCGLSEIAMAILVALMVLIAFFYLSASTKRYRSPATFLAFVESQRRRNATMLQKGYVKETSPGRFEHTPAYYSSAEYKASRSSRSSSSSSSSSGGGRSGGGGASSGW